MAAKKRTRKPRAMEVPVSQDESMSVDVRKISNGFVVRHSHNAPGKPYKSTETYHPTKPTITAPVAPPKPVLKAKRAPASFGLKKKRIRKP